MKLDGEAIAVMIFLGNMAENAVVPAICTAKIEMVTRTYRIDEAPQAFEDLECGANARGVIVYD